MIQLYQTLPVVFAEPYAALFAQLAQGAVPLVFNCSAGKDRTGVVAALVLTCLGVPWMHVLADYRLTDELVDLEQVFRSRSPDGVGLGADSAQFYRLSPEVRDRYAGHSDSRPPPPQADRRQQQRQLLLNSIRQNLGALSVAVQTEDGYGCNAVPGYTAQIVAEPYAR